MEFCHRPKPSRRLLFLLLPYHLLFVSGDERGSQSPFPKPRVGAVLCSSDGRVLGQGRSDYQDHAIVSAFTDAGLLVTPLSEWAVSWPTKPGLRKDLSDATLYVTLEPSPNRLGDLCPPLTQLVTACGIKRVVIGCADPIVKTEGAAELHKSGLEVVLGMEEEDCTQLSEGYTKLARSKLQSMARRHFKKTGRVCGITLVLLRFKFLFLTISFFKILIFLKAPWIFALLCGLQRQC